MVFRLDKVVFSCLLSRPLVTLGTAPLCTFSGHSEQQEHFSQPQTFFFFDTFSIFPYDERFSMNKWIVNDVLRPRCLCVQESRIQSFQTKLNFRALLKQVLIVMEIPLY